jgi:hypothetical protein
MAMASVSTPAIAAVSPFDISARQARGLQFWKPAPLVPSGAEIAPEALSQSHLRFSMLDAWDSGIAFVSQELNLFPNPVCSRKHGLEVVSQSQVSARRWGGGRIRH